MASHDPGGGGDLTWPQPSPRRVEVPDPAGAGRRGGGDLSSADSEFSDLLLLRLDAMTTMVTIDQSDQSCILRGCCPRRRMISSGTVQRWQRKTPVESKT